MEAPGGGSRNPSSPMVRTHFAICAAAFNECLDVGRQPPHPAESESMCVSQRRLLPLLRTPGLDPLNVELVLGDGLHEVTEALVHAFGRYGRHRAPGVQRAVHVTIERHATHPPSPRRVGWI